MAAVAPARIPDSPGSSPRLPSPPPMPEFQFGPQSPSVAASTTELQVDAPNKPDESAQRRIRPGTKAVDMAKGPPLVPLTQLDSAFQLQEHLKSLYAQFTHGQSSSHTVPITRDSASQIATPPQLTDGESVDKNLWLYELCRFLTMKANLVSVALMADTPPCSSITCPEMRASEWQYLCAVHEPPKSCCAIDYVNHTLDWAANVLTSTKHFPSRLQLGGETGNVFQSMRQLTNIFRRVYRIFAHAWFQHREVFWHIETTYGIYMLFKTVCDKYQLIPEDNYTVPPEAEGSRDNAETPISTSPEMNTTMHILRKDNDETAHQNGHDSSSDIPTTVSTGATTRRHKHTPSTGSHVATIAEGTEEEEEQSQAPLLSSSSPPEPNKPPSERATPQSLGRLDIANTVPAYTLSNPEDPTPTTATSDKDPMSAAKFSVSSPPPTEDVPTQTQPQPQSHQPQPADSEQEHQRQQTPEPTGPGNVNVKVRRDSGLESEVRSPTGGSLRTAGIDVLSAVLGHIEGYDDEAEANKGESAAKSDAAVEEEEEDVKGKEEGKVRIEGVAVKEGRQGEEKEKEEEEKEEEDVKPAAKAAGGGGGSDDEDENEMMEEIVLPDKASPETEGGVVKDAEKEESRAQS